MAACSQAMKDPHRPGIPLRGWLSTTRERKQLQLMQTILLMKIIIEHRLYMAILEQN